MPAVRGVSTQDGRAGGRPWWARPAARLHRFAFRGLARVQVLGQAIPAAVLQDAEGTTIALPLSPTEADELERTLGGQMAVARVLLRALRWRGVRVSRACLTAMRGLAVEGGVTLSWPDGGETWLRCPGAVALTLATACGLEVLVAAAVAREMGAPPEPNGGPLPLERSAAAAVHGPPPGRAHARK